jgi:hypothetical protein
VLKMTMVGDHEHRYFGPATGSQPHLVAQRMPAIREKISPWRRTDACFARRGFSQRCVSNSGLRVQSSNELFSLAVRKSPNRLQGRDAKTFEHAIHAHLSVSRNSEEDFRKDCGAQRCRRIDQQVGDGNLARVQPPLDLGALVAHLVGEPQCFHAMRWVVVLVGPCHGPIFAGSEAARGSTLPTTIRGRSGRGTSASLVSPSAGADTRVISRSTRNTYGPALKVR